MNARMFAALPFAVVIGLFASTPVLAQNAVPASAGSSMSHDNMQHKDAMKDSMHKHGTMMKKDGMHGDTMKHMSMRHGAMMKKDDSMKMKKAGSEPEGSGG